MNNQTITNLGMRMATAVALLASGATMAQAQERQALTLGYANTPLLQAVKGGRYAVDGRGLLRGKNGKAGARLAKADFRNVDMVAADLREIEISAEDRELIEAAKDAGIPVVLENASGEKMAALFGIGVESSLVVVEFDARTKRSRLNLADPIAMEEVPGYVQMPQPYENFGDRVQYVKDIVEKRPFTRGAQMQSMLGNCNQAPFTNGAGCAETEITNPPVMFCPAKAIMQAQYVYGNLASWDKAATIYSCAWGMVMVDPRWEAGLYKINTRLNGVDTVRYYTIVRATGGGGVVAPNGIGDPVRINADHEQFPFFTLYKVSMLPRTGVNGSVAGMPAGWYLDKASPSNENRTGTITTTTGWSVSVGATGGGTPEGPNGTVSAQVSYERSRTSSILVSDWSILNSSASPNMVVSYYMSNTNVCGGESKPVALTDYLGDAMTKKCGMRFKVGVPPLWSTSGNKYSGPLAETVWVGETAAPFQINVTVDAKVNDVQIIGYGNLGFDAGYRSYVQDDPRQFNKSLYFDPAAMTAGHN